MIFRLDPCGIFCTLISYSIIAYSDYVVIEHLVQESFGSNPWISTIIIVFFNILIFLAVCSHLAALLSNPGILDLPMHPIDIVNPNDIKDYLKTYPAGWRYCAKCRMFRPPRFYHCRICRRCIFKMDHHCPWVNNCVGAYNQRYFLQFLIYVGLLTGSGCIIVLVSWLNDPSAMAHGNKQVKIIHSVILILISLFFGLFVWTIFIDQIQNIFRDETAVEHIKKNRSVNEIPRLSKRVLLRHVFGNGPVFLWFCPFHRVPRSDFTESSDVADTSDLVHSHESV